jgi:hypothetical protein
MHDAAADLKEIAEIAVLEAIGISTVEKHFSERRGERRERRAQ